MSQLRSTGLADVDARDDFTRARRRAMWAKVAARLRGQPGEVDALLPYDEVVAALGRRGFRRLGEQFVPLDAIVGSTDRMRGFDRRFRPTSSVARQRFERLAAAARRGEELPPVELYKVGPLYFVRDGHHRVAVARTLGWQAINASVVDVLTALPADEHLTLADLPVKGHERLFRERVPLPPDAAGRIALTDPEDYMRLAEGVEAWGFRVMQARGEFLDRRAVAELWWHEEYEPAVRLLREAGLLTAEGSETEAFLHFAAERYRLLLGHHWDAGTVEEVRAAASGRRRRPTRRRRRRRG